MAAHDVSWKCHSKVEKLKVSCENFGADAGAVRSPTRGTENKAGQLLAKLPLCLGIFLLALLRTIQIIKTMIMTAQCGTSGTSVACFRVSRNLTSGINLLFWYKVES